MSKNTFENLQKQTTDLTKSNSRKIIVELKRDFSLISHLVNHWLNTSKYQTKTRLKILKKRFLLEMTQTVQLKESKSHS